MTTAKTPKRCHLQDVLVALSVLTLCDICSDAKMRCARAAALQVCCPLAVAAVHIEEEQRPSVINSRICAAGNTTAMCAAISVVADPTG